MVNFGPLAAEILSLVWGTPGNFNGFRVLAALLHDTLVVGVSQSAALNRGRHLYSAGRPSRWALAHILVLFLFCRAQVCLAAATGRSPELYVSDALRIQADWISSANEFGIRGSPGEDTEPDAVWT